jgi:hypothetical protein
MANIPHSSVREYAYGFKIITFGTGSRTQRDVGDGQGRPVNGSRY